MKKNMFIILIFITVFLVAIGAAVYAETEVIEYKNDEDQTIITVERPKSFKSSKSAMPNIDRIYDSESNSYKYITKYKDQFALDFEESWFILDSDEIYNANANVMFSIQQSLIETIIFLVDKVYNFKVYSLFKDFIEKIVSGMYLKNANIFISIMLSMLGIYFAYKIIVNQKADFFTTLIKTILIITIGLFFFNKPGLILDKMDYVINNISNEILDLQSNVSTTYENTSEDGSVNLANFMWEQYILKPWQFLEFGDSEIAEKYTDEILSMSPGSDERAKRLNEIFEKENVYTQNMPIDRLSFICVYYIPLIINLVMISLICVLILGYQFLAIIVFLLGIFVMILALLPNGTNLLKVWASKLFGFTAMKIFLTFLFTILISVNEILFDNVKSQGWIAILAIQVLFYIMIVIKRNSLISIFVSLQSELSNPYMALNRLRTIKELPYMQSFYRNSPVETTNQTPPKNYKYNIYQSFYRNIPRSNNNQNSQSNSSPQNSNVQSTDNEKQASDVSKINRHIKAKSIQSNKLRLHRNPQFKPIDYKINNLKPQSDINSMSNDSDKKQTIVNLNKNKSENSSNNINSNNTQDTNNNFNIKNHIERLKQPPKKSMNTTLRNKNLNKRSDKKDD